MCFHVRITMVDVNKKPSRSIIALGETVIVDSEGKAIILTADIQRKYAGISYSLDVSILFNSFNLPYSLMRMKRWKKLTIKRMRKAQEEMILYNNQNQILLHHQD